MGQEDVVGTLHRTKILRKSLKVTADVPILLTLPMTAITVFFNFLTNSYAYKRFWMNLRYYIIQGAIL